MAEDTRSKSSINEFLEFTWVYNYRTLVFLGQWPYSKPATKLILRIIVLILNVVGCLTSVIALYEDRNDFNNIIEDIPMVMTGIVFYPHYINNILQQNKMRHLLDMIQQDFRTIAKKSDVELEIMKKAAIEAKSDILLFIGHGHVPHWSLDQTSTLPTFFGNNSCPHEERYRFKILESYTYKMHQEWVIVTVSTFFIMTLIPVFLDIITPLNETRERNYVYRASYLVLDTEENYFFVYSHSIIVGITSIGTGISTGLMLYYFLHHACGLFRVLGYRLKNVCNHAEDENSQYPRNREEIEKEIVSCFQLYQNILNYVELVDKCFGNVLLLVMGLTATILSFQGVMIVVKIDEPDFLLKFLANFIGEAMNLFYNCLAGQNLINHSNEFLNSIYESNWLTLTMEQKKGVMIMMLRACRECKVTIGHLSTLSIETYSSLMKTVFSYLSVLLSVRT